MDQSQNPEENQKPEENLSEEFRNLGKNLMDAVRTAWESPERRKLQQEISSGLQELGATLRKEAQSISESETGKRIKSDVQEAQQRIRSGEVETRVRDELLSALQTVNTELQKVIESWSERGEPGKTGQAPYETRGEAASAEAHSEMHPDDVESTVDREEKHVEIHPDDIESDAPPNPS